MSEKLWFHVSRKRLFPKDLTLGGLEDGVCSIDRQLRKIDPSRSHFLSPWLLPWLQTASMQVEKPIGHSRVAPSPDDLVAAATALEELELRLAFPKGTCVLTQSYSWPFDIESSEEAVDWVIRRVLEYETLLRLHPAVARAAFPFPGEGNAAPDTQFGPFNGLGIVLNLKSCAELTPALARLAVPTREKWHHYVIRNSEPLRVTRFPPLTHCAGVMVGHREFTDEVAMDVYGVFSCTVEVLVEGGQIASLHPTSAAEESAAAERITLSEGAVELRGLNGATVLFIACLILRAESSVHKLLDMEVTGMVILHDLAEHGLGWMLTEADAGAIIARWLKCPEFYPANPPPMPKLSLLLEAWMSRAFGNSAPNPMLLYREAERLMPRSGEPTAQTANRFSRPDFEEGVQHDSTRFGLFCGSAAGTAMSLFLRMSDNALSTHSSASTEVGKWAHQLLASAARQHSNSPLMSAPASEACEKYLKQSLRNVKPQGLKTLDRLHDEAHRKLSTPPGDVVVRLRYFYRALLVSLTGGRLRDDGETPLEWSESLSTDTCRKRRALLGLPSDDQGFRAASRTESRLSSRLPGLVVVCALSVTAALLMCIDRLKGIPGAAAPVPLSNPLTLNMTAAIGRMLKSVGAGSHLKLSAEDLVYVYMTPESPGLRTVMKNGAIGVRPQVFDTCADYSSFLGAIWSSYACQAIGILCDGNGLIVLFDNSNFYLCI